jgi:ribosomal protein L37AE/L43A
MLNDIKGTLLNLTRNVSKTGGSLVKTTKLTVTLAQEPEAVKALDVEIGTKVHEIYQYGGSLGKFFDEKYREIEGLERKIDGLKDEIAKIKGVKECPKCGKQVDKNAEFCPKCGLKLDGAAHAGEAPPPYNPGERPFAASPPSSAEPYATVPPSPGGPFAASPPSSAEPYAAVPPSPGGPFASSPPSPAEPFTAAPSSSAGPFAGAPPAAAAASYENPGVFAPPIPSVPTDASASAAPPSIVAAPPKTVTCKVCGAQNEPATKFCLSCGRLM